MSYTQTAFTGRTGARPITAFTRRVVNALKVVEPDGLEVTKWQARKMVEALKGATAVSDGAIETLVDLVQLSWDADWKDEDRKSTRLNSSHIQKSRMPSSA